MFGWVDGDGGGLLVDGIGWEAGGAAGAYGWGCGCEELESRRSDVSMDPVSDSAAIYAAAGRGVWLRHVSSRGWLVEKE